MRAERDPIRVVVVEDSDAFLMRLRLVLSEAPGLVVAGVAESAGPAIRLIDQVKPDLVLLDLYLKEGSGIDVLQHIAESGLKARTLVMTSEQSGELRLACFSLGAYGVFDKAELTTVLPDELATLARDLGGDAVAGLAYGKSANAD